MAYPGNPNCDGGHCTSKQGEVRVLPLSRQLSVSGNLILCRACFNNEIEWRKGRNRELGKFARFDLPAWEELEVYEVG